MRRFEQVRLAVVETQAQAVAVQQHQFTVDAGKRGERRIALDLGDRKPPGPVAAGIGTMRMDLTGPAQAVAPALRSAEHTSTPVTNAHLVCRLLLAQTTTQ